MKRNVLHLALSAVAVATLAAGIVTTRGGAGASGCATTASTYAWQGNVLAYGIRDFAVSFCGPSTLDVYAGAQWKGNKALSVAMIGPDGVEHVYTGRSDASGEVSGPLAAGTWTLVVRNNSTANVQFSAALSFK